MTPGWINRIAAWRPQTRRGAAGLYLLLLLWMVLVAPLLVFAARVSSLFAPRAKYARTITGEEGAHD